MRIELHPSTQFLADVLTTCIETPFGDQFRWRVRERREDYTVVLALVQYEDPKGADLPWKKTTITLERVEEGIKRLLQARPPMVNSEITWAILRGIQEDDAGNVDSIGVDAILQAAVYGWVLFG